MARDIWARQHHSSDEATRKEASWSCVFSFSSIFQVVCALCRDQSAVAKLVFDW